MKLLWFLFITVIPKETRSQTANDIANNPNDFYMFENFELTHTVHQMEKNLIKRLKEVHQHLIKEHTYIKSLIDVRKKENCTTLDHLKKKQCVVDYSKELQDLR